MKTYNCHTCKKEYNPKFYVSTRPEPKYCSVACMQIAFTKKPLKSLCLNCKKEFEHKENKRKYCSVKCIKPINDITKFKRPRADGFWHIATDEQKLERLKYYYDKKVVKNDGCWGWIGVVGSMGYGCLQYLLKQISAHRASWIIHYGKIPADKFVLHKCDNRICSNPEHLFLGTPKDNMQDMHRKGRNRNSKQNAKSAKLNREKAHQIKELLKYKTQKEIANAFGVSPGTIQNIADGRTWRDC